MTGIASRSLVFLAFLTLSPTPSLGQAAGSPSLKCELPEPFTSDTIGLEFNLRSWTDSTLPPIAKQVLKESSRFLSVPPTIPTTLFGSPGFRMGGSQPVAPDGEPSVYMLVSTRLRLELAADGTIKDTLLFGTTNAAFDSLLLSALRSMDSAKTFAPLADAMKIGSTPALLDLRLEMVRGPAPDDPRFQDSTTVDKSQQSYKHRVGVIETPLYVVDRDISIRRSSVPYGAPLQVSLTFHVDEDGKPRPETFTSYDPEDKKIRKAYDRFRKLRFDVPKAGKCKLQMRISSRL